MMPTIKQAATLCTFILCGCAATAAVSQESAPATTVQATDTPAPYQFDCDAPLGKFKAMRLNVPQGAFRVTGFFKIFNIDSKGLTSPQVRIALRESNGTEQIALVAMVLDSTIGLSLSKSRYVDYYARIARSVRRIPFAVTLDSQGKVTGSVEDVSSAAKSANSAIVGLTLGCSSTHASFTDVTIVPLK